MNDFSKIIKNLSEYETKKIFDTFAKFNEYIETPPTITEFISNDYYLGKSLNNGKVIFPFWKKKLVQIFPTPFFESNKYKILLFSGSTGIGKTTISQIILLYDLARTLCLKSPQEKFRLPKSAKIYFMLSNSTLENAETINLDPIISFIRDSAFFRDKFSKDQRRNMFINNIDLGTISRKRSLVGKNVLAALSDEINVEVQKGGSKKLVIEMFNRINSRFILPGDKWPGHYCLISSATTESSLINSLIENKANKKDVLIISAPRYEVKKHLNVYSGEKFKIFIGNYQSDPFLINSEEELKRAEDLDPTKIYNVPIEHKQEFETDIYAGIRDVIGLAISDVRTFIPFKDKIRKSLSLTKLCLLDEVILSSDNERLINKFQKQLIDSFKPGSQKVIGIDVGISGDRLGIAMCHIHDQVKKERYNPESKDVDLLPEFIYWVDFAIGIKPPKGQQLPLYKIREFIYDLRDLGVNISYIVSDTFQSFDMIQMLQKQGFNALMNSVDRKKEAYYLYRNAIYEERVLQPFNKILYKELIYLQENEKKIDHPEAFPDGSIGSKDIADAVCNALYIASTKLKYNPYESKEFREQIIQSLNKDEDFAKKIFGENADGFESLGKYF